MNKPLVYRHNRITRFTHWSNALALMILLMSGLMIFNAHQQLYWGHTSEPERALLSIGAKASGGEARGFVEVLGSRLDTTGMLGVRRTADGVRERAFPSWLTVPGYYSLAGARRWHFFFGWFFTINGMLYVVYNLAVGHLRKFFFTPSDAAQVPAMIAYYLKLRKESPQVGAYNPLQKMAYTSVIVLMTPAVLLSGMAMSPQLNVAFNWMPAMFGGRQSARTIHFILAFSFLFFAFGHVFMVITQGVFNNMRSMITGSYREKIPSVIEAPPVRVEAKIADAPKEEISAPSTEAAAPLVEAATKGDAHAESAGEAKEAATPEVAAPKEEIKHV